MIVTLGTTPAVQRSMAFDHLLIDGVNRTAKVRQYASGKAVNAARVLHTLGRETLTMGFTGGLTGQFMLDDLSAAGIDHDFVEVEPATRICVTVIDNRRSEATELVEESAPVAEGAYGELLDRFTTAMNRRPVACWPGVSRVARRSIFMPAASRRRAEVCGSWTRRVRRSPMPWRPVQRS